MKRLIIKTLIKVRKVKKYFKNRNKESVFKSKEDLILELLTKDLSFIEIIALKKTIDIRFKTTCIKINREAKKTTKTFNSYYHDKL
jgi:hypothetical protein